MGKDLAPVSHGLRRVVWLPPCAPHQHPRTLCRLGLAYAGSNREDVLTLLLPVMGDSKSSMEVRSEAGFAWGSCFLTQSPTAPGDTGTILQPVQALGAGLHVPA